MITGKPLHHVSYSQTIWVIWNQLITHTKIGIQNNTQITIRKLEIKIIIGIVIQSCYHTNRTRQEREFIQIRFIMEEALKITKRIELDKNSYARRT